ncbi:MAG: NnrS family protein [Chloroflexi bacterium]|nr:NnrS family protein [Chloroflexota bacterium]
MQDARHAHHEDTLYRRFVFASLALAIGGGFLLSALLPLAQAMEWDWGRRWLALAQAHGQLQLLGFGGLFAMGMALRMVPRFAGRELAYPALAVAVMPSVASSLVLRALAQPAGDSAVRDTALLVSAALLLGGGCAFAAIILRMLARPGSRAEAVGYFFVLGSVAYVAGAVINLLQVVEMVRDGLPLAPVARQLPLIIVQQFGFILMFMSGIATRAVPTFTGRPRADRGGRVTALVLACGVAAVAGAGLWESYRSASVSVTRVMDAGLLICATAFVAVVLLSGIFHPRANRVAIASQTQFHFVRAAMAWLLVAAALIAWYAGRALIDGRALDVYEADAIRHTLTVGVMSMMIIGIGMMIVPEFAGRRLQHPDERGLILGMLLAMNLAAVLRLWPALRGLDWIASTRWWPMAAAGGLAECVIVVFGLMFVQSYFEQRQRGWGSPQALASRTGRGSKAT